jgi:hypothetical protein
MLRVFEWKSMKSCNNPKCNELNPQPPESFSKNRATKDGLRWQCRACDSVYRKENKEKRDAYNKEWDKSHPGWRSAYEKQWNKDNPDKVRAKDAKWRKNNPAKRAAKQMRRQANKFKATPSWLTKEQHEQILEFYALAKELQWLSEEPLEVDHIIPLQGENVSGLHVPWNLQILPKSLNIKKGNRSHI